MGESGWPFASVDPFPGANADPLYNAQHVKDLYFKADPSYGGRYAIMTTSHRSDLPLTPLVSKVHRPGSLGQEDAHDCQQRKL